MADAAQPLLGKVALVTGAGGGIGKAVVLRLARGWSGYFNVDKKTDDLQAVADEITKLGRKCVWTATDMGVMEDVSKLVDKAKTDFGKMDILVNCAAVSPFLGRCFRRTRSCGTRSFRSTSRAPLPSLGIAKLMIENGPAGQYH